MALQSHGRTPVPDHLRVHRATEPRLRQPIPALNVAVDNANQTLDRVVVLLNRAGSSRVNPMLEGLGLRLELHVGLRDRVTAVYVFQNRNNLGNNQLSSLVTLAPGVFGLDVVLGAGLSQAGDTDSGAVKNYVRVETKRGAIEREFYVKDFDPDVVSLDGENALDEDLAPVCRTFNVVDSTQPWLDVPIDFFLSWNDEFGGLHRAGNPDIDPGALKAYGGALLVSFFDADTATEGVGVECNPVTQQLIADVKTLQVQNTAGQKDVTVRFRSKQDSLYFRDVMICVVVAVEVCAPAEAPVMEVCSAVYVPAGTPVVENTPATPSVVGAPTLIPAPGTPAVVNLLVVTMRGQFTGSAPRVRVRRWAVQPVAEKLCGTLLLPLADEVYIPDSRVLASSPSVPAPYNLGRIYVIALSAQQLSADGVAFIEAMLQAGDDPPNAGVLVGWALTSHSMLIAGPKCRDLCFFPPGNVGGGPGCCGAVDDVADFNDSCGT